MTHKYNQIIHIRSDLSGKVIVYRPNGCRFDDKYIKTIRRCGRKTVSVWGWFSSEGAGVLHRIEGTLNGSQYLDILDDVLLPSARERYPDGKIRLVHDKSSIHQCKIVKNWIKDHPDIEELPWPPKGCDMNPIENVWADMVYEMDAQNVKNKEELWEKIEDLWELFANRASYWKTLSNSIHGRLQMVADVNGAWTKY